MVNFKKPGLSLNVDDPEQKELYDFVTRLPNGKKRNASAFLKTLVDREYQKKKEEYLVERKRFEQEKKTPEAPKGDVIKSKNGRIRYELNKNSPN